MPHGVWAHNDIAQISLIGAINSQQIVLRHNFEAPGAVQATLTTDALKQAWATSVRNDWRTNLLTTFRAMLSTDYSLVTIRAQIVEANGAYEHRLVSTDDVASLPLAGTLAQTQQVLTNAGVIRWRSLFASRSQRGRTFVPLPGGGTTGGLVNTGNVTVLSAYAAALVARYGANSPTFADATLTVYSRPFDENERYRIDRHTHPPTVTAIPVYDGNSANVVSQTVDPYARVQRRREFGRGA